MNEEQTRVFWAPVGSAPELVTKDLAVYCEGDELRAVRPMGTIRMAEVNFGDDDQPGWETKR